MDVGGTACRWETSRSPHYTAGQWGMCRGQRDSDRAVGADSGGSGQAGHAERSEGCCPDASLSVRLDQQYYLIVE